MRSIRHITPRYIVDRIKLWCYERRFPKRPWLTRDAAELLEKQLKPIFKGIEWGSGRSSLWFASRIEHLISVEHNELWHGRVKQMLEDQSLTNVEQHLVEAKDGEESGQAILDKYASVVLDVEDSSLDFALVDALNRAQCILNVIPKIKPGGILIFDNSNWYIPSSSRAPSPAKIVKGQISDGFKEVLNLTSDWEKLETTNGVWDTVIWTKK